MCNCPTLDLLFDTRNNVHGLLQDRQFRLQLLVAEMHRTHAPELVKRIINISHPYSANQQPPKLLLQTWLNAKKTEKDAHTLP